MYKFKAVSPPPTPTKCDDFTNYGNGPDAGPLVKLSKAYFHYICTLCTLQYGSLFKLTFFSTPFLQQEGGLHTLSALPCWGLTWIWKGEGCAGLAGGGQRLGEGRSRSRSLLTCPRSERAAKTPPPATHTILIVYAGSAVQVRLVLQVLQVFTNCSQFLKSNRSNFYLNYHSYVALQL